MTPHPENATTPSGATAAPGGTTAGSAAGSAGADPGAAGLEVHGATVDFPVRRGTLRALDAVDLVVPAGTLTAVLGPSGCGKSTLLRAVAGLETLTAGRVRFGDRDVTDVPPHRRGFALVFQDGQLFDHLTVEQNVAYALRLRGVARARRRQRTAELLEMVGLPGIGRRDPRTLSGGQRQRIALARGLAAEPHLLLLDEPLSALDRDLRTQLGADLRRIIDETRTTAMLVTHDHEEARLADAVARMASGRIEQVGPPGEVLGGSGAEIRWGGAEGGEG
ncbi:ABC transporter ATP-binding protein [Kytococcus sedentarius]|uniref:ABC transporter ATP-binding protein n=1 Tax=Kytococcus sedentarius TaxID=1276 RepID=UPI0035BBEBCF